MLLTLTVIFLLPSSTFYHLYSSIEYRFWGQVLFCSVFGDAIYVGMACTQVFSDLLLFYLETVVWVEFEIFLLVEVRVF